MEHHTLLLSLLVPKLNPPKKHLQLQTTLTGGLPISALCNSQSLFFFLMEILSRNNG